MSIDRAKALKNAQKFLAKGQVDRAIIEFEKIVAADGSDARSLLKLGDLYIRKGDNRGAANTYRKVATQYAGGGFFLKAVAVYKQIQKLEPGDLNAAEGLASMYEKLSLHSDAVTAYEHLVHAFARGGKADRVLFALEKLADLDRDNVAAWIRYAEALSKANRIDEAIDAFTHGADLLKRQGNIEDFIKVTERLLFHSHNDLARARELAKIYIDRGQTKAALGHLQTCFKADPKNVETLGLLSQAFVALEQTPKAISVLREVARLHADAGDVEAETGALRALLELDPNDADAQTRLEDRDEDSGEIVIVDEDSPPTSIRPSVPPPDELERMSQVARLMAECEVFIRYGLRDKIIVQLGRVLELEPDHVEAREKLKAAHLKRGEVGEAVTQLLRLTELAGDDVAKARTYLEEAAQLRPDDAAIARRLEELQEDTSRDSADEVVFVDEDDDDVQLVAESSAPEAPEKTSVTPSEMPGRPSEVSFASLLEDDDDDPELVLEQSDDSEDQDETDEDEADEDEADQDGGDQNAGDEDDEIPEAITEALEEADFYLAQGLLDEARDALSEVLLVYPQHSALQEKAAEVATKVAQAEAAEAQSFEDRSFALAQKLAEDTTTTTQGAQGPVGADQVLQQFKEGVKRQVDKADSATHYDLGIAYIEMGLYAEAIEAFTMCLESPGKQCTAHSMIGLAYVAKGDMQKGIVHLKQALASPQRSPDEEIGLWFEIGNATELSGKVSEALVWYEKVEERDPNFRDVAARIERLGTIKTPEQEGDDFDDMFDNMILKD